MLSRVLSLRARYLASLAIVPWAEKTLLFHGGGVKYIKMVENDVSLDALIEQTLANLYEINDGRMNQAGENLKHYQRLSQEGPEQCAEFLKTLNDNELYDMKIMQCFTKMQTELNTMESLERETRLKLAEFQAKERAKQRYEQPSDLTYFERMRQKEMAEFLQHRKESPMYKREQLINDRVLQIWRENLAAKPEDKLSPNEMWTKAAREVDATLDAEHDQARAKVQEVAAARLMADFAAMTPEERAKHIPDNFIGLTGVNTAAAAAEKPAPQAADTTLTNGDQLRAALADVKNNQYVPFGGNKESTAEKPADTVADNIDNIKHMLASGNRELTAENVDLALGKLSDRLHDNPAMYRDIEQAAAVLKYDLMTQDVQGTQAREDFGTINQISTETVAGKMLDADLGREM